MVRVSSRASLPLAHLLLGNVLLALPVLALTLLAGCTTSRTEVILVVDTDLRGTGGIDNLSVEVTTPAGATTTSLATLGPGQPALPRTLGLVHEDGALGPYSVHVVGKTGAAVRVTRDVRFTLQEGRTLMLRIDLVASCESARCGSGQTCAAGACRSIDLALSELTEWTGTPPALVLDGAVPPLDAGDRDLGTPLDAGADDAGPADSGPADAGPTDAGPADAGPADAGPIDAGPADAGPIDAGPIDAGPPDAGPIDAGPIDAGPIDAGPPDAGPVDAGIDACFPSSEVCNGLDDDCNGTIDDGFNLATDVLNCGACGHACNFQNSTGTCRFGVCRVSACSMGFSDCNRNGDDGCEVDLVNDRTSCGFCGNACSSTRNCCFSMCSRTCP